MSGIVVLGGGAQGRVIATDLATAHPTSRITVADVRRPKLPELPNLKWVEADCADSETLVRLLSEHGMGVGALPSHLGFNAMRAAIEAKRNLVDVSFCAENALDLDAEATVAGVTILPDCGLAPGLSHLCVGFAASHGIPDEVMIMVGGVAQDPTLPYGYVVTWSLEDLEEEYTRPARVMRDALLATVPVFSGLERVRIEGVGEMEAWYSDGLRTLMETMPGVPTMGEKTLRWPGHAEAVQPLLEGGRLVEEFRARCTFDPPEDLVAMTVRVRQGKRARLMTLVDRYDADMHMTAMSRTTALTCSAVAQLVAEGGVTEKGVLPLERLGGDEDAYSSIIRRLDRHNVTLSWSAG